MASYSLALRATALKEISWLEPRDVRALMDALLLLVSDPRPRGAKALAGGQRFRLTAAGYRVAYTVDDERARIEVAGFAHGHAAYRGSEDPASYFL